MIIDEGCTSSLEVVDRGLGEKLDEATNNNQTSVLLVDAWAARESRYRAPLSDYDRQNHPVTGVLVPCHETDEESVDEKLWTDLQQIFRRNWMRRNDPYDPLFQVQVERQRFEDRLARMVVVAQNRLMEKAVPRPAARRAVGTAHAGTQCPVHTALQHRRSGRVAGSYAPAEGSGR